MLLELLIHVDKSRRYSLPAHTKQKSYNILTAINTLETVLADLALAWISLGELKILTKQFLQKVQTTAAHPVGRHKEEPIGVRGSRVEAKWLHVARPDGTIKHFATRYEHFATETLQLAAHCPPLIVSSNGKTALRLPLPAAL